MADNADLNPPICADLDGLDLAAPRQVGTPVEDFNQTLGQLVATLSPDQRTQAIEKLKELAICSSVMADMLGASPETMGLEAPPAPEVEGRDAPSRPLNEKQISGPPGFPAKAVLSQGTRGVPTERRAPCRGWPARKSRSPPGWPHRRTCRHFCPCPKGREAVCQGCLPSCRGWPAGP